MRRWFVPAVALALLAVGLGGLAPPGFRNVIRSLWIESPDEELDRLDRECQALRAEIEQSSEAMTRLRRQYAEVTPRALRPQAMQRLRVPMYELRDRIERAREQLAEKELRAAFLGDDQRRLIEPLGPDTPSNADSLDHDRAVTHDDPRQPRRHSRGGER